MMHRAFKWVHEHDKRIMEMIIWAADYLGYKWVHWEERTPTKKNIQQINSPVRKINMKRTSVALSPTPSVKENCMVKIMSMKFDPNSYHLCLQLCPTARHGSRHNLK